MSARVYCAGGLCLNQMFFSRPSSSFLTLDGPFPSTTGRTTLHPRGPPQTDGSHPTPVCTRRESPKKTWTWGGTSSTVGEDRGLSPFSGHTRRKGLGVEARESEKWATNDGDSSDTKPQTVQSSRPPVPSSPHPITHTVQGRPVPLPRPLVYRHPTSDSTTVVSLVNPTRS